MEAREMIEKRQLSRRTAGIIAESQSDLGTVSKTHMAVALGGVRFNNGGTHEELTELRLRSFKNLDPLSQYIVKIFLSNDEEGALGEIGYTIKNLKAAADAVRD